MYNVYRLKQKLQHARLNTEASQSQNPKNFTFKQRETKGHLFQSHQSKLITTIAISLFTAYQIKVTFNFLSCYLRVAGSVMRVCFLGEEDCWVVGVLLDFTDCRKRIFVIITTGANSLKGEWLKRILNKEAFIDHISLMNFKISTSFISSRLGCQQNTLVPIRSINLKFSEMSFITYNIVNQRTFFNILTQSPSFQENNVE